MTTTTLKKEECDKLKARNDDDFVIEFIEALEDLKNGRFTKWKKSS